MHARLRHLRLLNLFLLLLAIAAGTEASSSVVPVRLSVESQTGGDPSSMRPPLHAWVIVDLAAYTQDSGSNFTSCGDTSVWTSLDTGGGAVAYSYGCWQSILHSNMNCKNCQPQPAGCMDAPLDESLFLAKGGQYVACGLSYWNDFLGPSGGVEVTRRARHCPRRAASASTPAAA